tara:strand:+ start:175 stop:657 length:483 start_codon:yes stop_codon:yes gene_type:complete
MTIQVGTYIWSVGFKGDYMKNNKLLLIIFAFLTSFYAITCLSNDEHIHHDDHSHKTHKHDVYADGSKIKLNSKRLDKFVEGVSQLQIAIINVRGMVCEFCAWGIEKTFLKDQDVTKIDIDLSKGKVLIAYKLDVKINFEEIKDKILSNGLDVTSMELIKI